MVRFISQLIMAYNAFCLWVAIVKRLKHCGNVNGLQLYNLSLWTAIMKGLRHCVNVIHLHENCYLLPSAKLFSNQHTSGLCFHAEKFIDSESMPCDDDRSGTINSNIVNSKFHLILSFFDIFCHISIISCLKCTNNSKLHQFKRDLTGV